MTPDRSADAARLRQALAANPGDRVAWHNLAAAEGDLGRAAESEASARRAIALGLAAPETRLVLARALQAQRRLDEAERAFEEAIALRPAYADAHRDLAQLRWMRTQDAAVALQRLRESLRAAPRDPGLRLVESVVLESAGDAAAALGAADAGLAVAPADRPLLLQAARLRSALGDAEGALALAQSAASKAPVAPAERIALCEALLGVGRVEEADAMAADLVARHPTSQYVIALQSTTWRLRNDPRYAALYDYGSLVRQERLEVPDGWPSLEAFLADVASELESLHGFRTHPLQQSVRGGSQLPLRAPELARPRLCALFGSISAAVQRYLERAGPGTDPLRSRNTGRFAITEAWSIRLRSGGHHADHIHPHGWLSSALHVALPPAIGRGEAGEGGHAGWLRLGQPCFSTRPPLAADHHVKPEAGSLVLFPAYMWHGVEPFEDERPRLSVAFDVLPA